MKPKLLCLFILTNCLASPIYAQESERPSLPIFSPPGNEPNQVNPEQLDIRQIDPISLPSGEEQKSFGAIEDVPIRSISFNGNRIISDEIIQGIIADYQEKTTLSVDDLKEIEERITSLYIEKGYLYSGAFISPENTIVDNQLDLKIYINEAKIYKISVAEAGRLNSYIRKQLRPLKGKVLDADKIYNKMRFLLDDDRIEDLSLDIIQTPQLENKELLFRAKAKNPFKLTTILNNGRSPSTGSFERGISAQHTNVFGLGDRINIDYSNTDGSNIVGVGHSIPVNSSGGEVELNYLFGTAKVLKDDLNDPDIKGNTQIFAMGYSQPVLRRSTNDMLQEITLGIRASRIENEDSLDGEPFPLTEGANEEGRLRSTTLAFAQSYLYKTRRHYLSLGSEFKLGLGLGTVNAQDFGNGEFFKWTGQALYSYRLSDRFRSISTMSLQLADRDLNGNEQFSLGGRGSVRAFSTNQLARTNGGQITQEFRYKAYDKADHQIELSAFFDFGTAWNIKPQLLEEDESMAGIGFGVSYQLAERVRASIEYAFPIFGRESATRSLQDRGLWLNLQFSF